MMVCARSIKQLEKRQVIVKTGVIVDASITESPFAPKGRSTYKEIQEGASKEAAEGKAKRQFIKEYHPGVDTQGRWVKKSGRLYYGYKKRLGADKNGMIRAAHATPVNEHDRRGLVPLICKLGKSNPKEVYADKSYQATTHVVYLEKRGVKARIQKKGYRNRPLAGWLFYSINWLVKRALGSIKRWFNSEKARYKGLARARAQHLMQTMAYNLYRLPGIIMRCS